MSQETALNYPAMDQTELEGFREQIKSVADNCPRAGLVGGAALRVYLDISGLPVPGQVSGDIDLVVNDYGLPEAGVHSFGSTVLDVFNTWAPFETPFFGVVEYQCSRLKIAEPEHLLAKKLEHLSAERVQDSMYLEILSGMVNRDSLAAYIEAIRCKVPSYIELDEQTLGVLASADILTAQA